MYSKQRETKRNKLFFTPAVKNGQHFNCKSFGKVVIRNYTIPVQCFGTTHDIKRSGINVERLHDETTLVIGGHTNRPLSTNHSNINHKCIDVIHRNESRWHIRVSSSNTDSLSYEWKMFFFSFHEFFFIGFLISARKQISKTNELVDYITMIRRSSCGPMMAVYEVQWSQSKTPSPEWL